jgi:hypothetical protein
VDRLEKVPPVIIVFLALLPVVIIFTVVVVAFVVIVMVFVVSLMAMITVVMVFFIVVIVVVSVLRIVFVMAVVVICQQSFYPGKEGHISSPVSVSPECLPAQVKKLADR